MGVKERYEKRKKDGEKSVYNGVKQRYLSNSAEDAASSISDRVNTWLKNHDTYISNYRYRYGDRKNSYDDSYVSDSGSYLDTVTKQKSAFDAEADSILSYMDQYKDYFNSEWVDSVRNAISSARDTQKLVVEGATSDNDWWSSFGSEEMLKAHGSAEEAYKYYQWDDGLKKKYTGATGDDIQKALDSLGVGEERDWLRINQGKIFGDSIRENTDFQDYVTTGSSLSYDDFGTETRHRGTSRRQRSTTSIDKYRAASLALAEHYGNEAPLGTYGQYDAQVAIFRTMDDKEFENLAYCIAYDKENGTNTAEQYVNLMEETLSNRRGTDIGEKITGIDIPVIEDLAVLGYGALAGVDNFAFGIEQFMSDDEVAYYPSYYANAHIADSLDGLGYYAHSAATNIGNMAPSILVSGVVSGLGVPSKVSEAIGSTTMGVSAAGSAYKEALAKGYDKESARTYSSLVGASEGLLQYLIGGVSKLGGVSNISSKLAGKISLIDDALLRGAAKYGMSIGSEIFEEEIQNFLEPAFRSIIFGEDYDAPTINEMIETAIVTALSTGVLEGGSTYTGIKEDMALDKQAAKDYGDKTDALIQEGLQNDVKSVSNKLAQKYQQQTQGKDGKGGKALTGSQIRNLLAANQAEVTKADLGKIQDAAANRLAQVGQRKDIYKIAELATKYATGQEMTRAERSTLARSNYGSQVASEMLNGIHPDKLLSKWENNMSEESGAEYSTDWAGEIDTESDQFIRFNNKKLARAILDHLANSVVEDPASYKSLESRVEAEEPAQVSDTGKSVIRGTDQEIDLTKPTFKKITDGVGVLEADGKLVSANNIDYADEKLGYAIRSVGKIENITPEAAGAVVSLVDMSKPVVAQMNGMDEAFTYGFNNYSEADLKAGLFTENLTPEQLNDAYKLGQYVRSKSDVDSDAPRIEMRTEADGKMTAEQKTAQQKERIKSNDVEVYFEDGGTVVKFDEHTGKYDDKRMAAVNSAKFLSKLGIGGKYYFFESYLSETLKDKKGNPLRVYKNAEGNEKAAPNGMYKDADGSIHIDLNAGNDGQGTALFTLGHELTHFVKGQSKKQFKVLGDLVTEAFSKTDMSMHKRVLAKQKFLEDIRGEAVSYTEAYEEVVADAMSTMLTDGSFHEKLMEIKVKDKGLFNAIKRFFEEMIAKFRKVYEELTPDQQDAQDIRELKDMFDKIQTAFAEALVEASENFYAMQEVGDIHEGMSNEEAFKDSKTAVMNQIRPPYSDGSKAFNAFVDELNPEARKTFDLFYGFYQKSRITNTLSVSGKRVKGVNISSVYLLADEWNDMLAKEPKWATAAQELANFLPEHIRKRMNMNEDGTLKPTTLEKEFKMPSSMAQRLVDALAYETIDGTYQLGDKAITLPEGKARQSVGGEAYRRAIIEETRKLYAEGNLRKVGIGTMSKDRWGSLGFLAANGKTGASGDFTTVCPQMMFNRGCWYCYRRAAMEKGVNNKLVAQSVWYTGEILRIKDSDIEALNRNGGLRIQSFGDWMPHFSAMLADVLYDAELRGLQVKIITKEPSMINYIAALREQGIGKNLYFNLSADYTIERGPAKFARDSESLDMVNPERPYVRTKDDGFWWKRAMTVEEANKYREKYPWVNTRIVATTLDEFIRGLKDSRVDVVTGYHGNIREFERVDSTTGEHKVNVEALGDAGMPRFAFNPATGKWVTEYEGKTATHKKLAQAIAENNLQMEYYTKTCCITGRCASCEGKCGALARDFNVKNATNRDSESVAYWQKQMRYAIKPEFGDMTTRKNGLDNSSVPGENKLTNDKTRGEVNDDNRRIREVSSENAGSAEDSWAKSADGRRNTGHVGETQKTVEWRDIDPSVRKAIKKTVKSHINSSANFNELYDYIVSLTGKSESDLTPYSYNKAVNNLTESVYIDAINLHPVLFENKWSIFGDGVSKLHSDIISATHKDAGNRTNVVKLSDRTRYSDRVLMGSLFSGGGTLEAGLNYQMLDKQFGVEYDGKIASVYSDNHGDHIQVGRVEDFDISRFDDIFYLHASPVCHNFSKAKHGAKELQQDIDSAKATAKHLETAMPQVFTVENAPGYRKSESLKIITDKLTELGYKWDVDVYNSADYGSATSRNRVILRSVKDGELPKKPTKQARTNSWDKVTRDLWGTLPEAELRPSFISAIENTPNLPILDANGNVNINKPLLILTTNNGHMVTYCWEGEICPTLTTKCGEARLLMPDGSIYGVTPEFMGRIQGLPDDYKYPKAKTRAFTIIGNGIPTHLTNAVVGGLLDSAYEQTHEGKTLYSERGNAPVFYSKMGKVVEGMKQEKFGASSVISMLRGRGVKAEEIRWSGIQAFLDGKKSITKDELLEFINGSMLKIEDQYYSNTIMYTEEQKIQRDMLSEVRDDLWDSVDQYWMGLYGEWMPYTLYSDDNGTNIIRDKVAQSGDSESESGKRLLQLADEIDQNRKDIAALEDESRKRTKLARWKSYSLPGGEHYREILFKIPGAQYTNDAMKTHWGRVAKGVLAHARMQDFEVDGKKMLFIEEIQSDWHNEGHKTGYVDESKRLTVDNTEMRHEGGWYNLYHNGEGLHQGVTEMFLKQRFPNGITEEEIHSGLVDEYNRVAVERKNGVELVPDAPFKDNYHEFVLKRLIRMAAEEGYDSIGWTTADIQSDRWSDEYAEGYRIEYDQDIPKFLKKYGKQWGAEVGKTKITTGELSDWEADMIENGIIDVELPTSTVWSMDITPAMKKSVLTEGQEMYSDRYNEMASNFTNHMENIVKTNHGWYAKDVFKYVEEHPELGFIELIYAKDKDVKKLLDKFLNGVDDVKVLENLSWYMGEAYGDKDRTWNPYDGATYPYRGAVRTFRNAIKKRINAIMTEKVGGTNLGIKNGEVTLGEVKEMFTRLNSNEEIGQFAEKVFATAEKLGVNIRFVNQTLAKAQVAGDNLGDMVEYKTSYFNDTTVTDQRKASTILHELIHACTVYVLDANKTMGDVSWNKSENYNRISNAATRLNRIYFEISYDTDFQGQYGIKNAKEMVAELANEEFVGLMKKKNLWDSIVDWICDLFGIRRGTSAYDNARLCVDYILDNPEVSEYKVHAAEQRRNASRNGYEVFGQTRFSERGEGTSNRHLLANAFEGLSRSSAEYKMIQDYKEQIKVLNLLDEQLSDLNAEIREIRFTKGKYDAEKLKKIEEKAERIARDIDKQDKVLIRMEASEPLRKIIAFERKKAAQKTKDHVNEIQQNKKVRAEQTELRHKIRKTIRDLDKLLNRGNKKLNVKEDVQNVVTKALQAADILFTDNYGTYDMLRNGIGADLSDSEEALVKTCTRMLKDLDKMPTDGYDNWQARQEAEKRLNTQMSKLKEVFARERKRLNNIKVSSILGELADAYASLEKSEQSYVQGAYTEAVHNFLKSLQSEVGGTIVKDMTKDQLEYVYAAYKMVLTTVRKANEMFNKELKMSREQLGNAVIQEVMNAGGVHGLWTKAELAASKADWNNMKPIWVANRIGSDTFGMLIKGLFEGQYNFAVDVEEAKQFKLSMDEKYKPRSWDAEKLYEFESSTGKAFSLNLQQIMSLYAFSKREQAYSHLLNGGFVFEGNSTVIVDENGRKKTYIHNGATSYKLNEVTLNEIINSLTKEQKAYVDEMQKYLSEVMGAKGNEVSMQLYGIKMFKEQFYFPLRSSGAYMERAKEAEMKKQQGQINLVNSGFTHAVKPEAKNPIILSGFMDVWAEHCNEMSMYHSMVLPMEDFRKVYNYSTVHDDKVDSASVYQTIQDAYGDAATAYIDQLYRELNAGATIDPRETTFKKLISNFKKTAVMLSASVVVQQFSSIGRAYALIDPKYFIGTKVNSDTQLSVAEEMRKYAPVAIIKEMGGFDTGTKGSAKSYIMAEKYAKGERRQGFLKDEQYRSDLMGILPAKADEKVWCAIWEAVKRETKAKHPKMDVKSEEFLKLAGERFSEVIEKTQVYDSVLARSANMRSKTGLMQMATSFMAEPTTTVNLLEDAIRRGDKKYMARAFGAVAVSIVLNNALASIVYAMRDDDEDETFIEKYFQSFTSGMIDDINPMSYYPFLKDVYSLFQGYDVERADMSVIADLRDALKKAISLIGKDTSGMDDDELAKHYKTVNSAILSLLDAGCSVFGVPLKNVRRDANGIINAFSTISKDLTERDTSWNSFWDKVGSAAKDTIPIYAWTKDESKADKLYEAIVSGDKAYLARLKSTYKTDSAYQSAVRKALRENDSRIHEAAQAKYEGKTEEYKRIFRQIQKEGKFSFDDIMSAINSEESAIRNKLEPDKATSSYTASDFVESIVLGDTKSAEAMKEDIIATKVANGKTPADAEKEFTSAVATGIHDAYSSGLLDEAGAENMLMEYAGKDEEEAASNVNYWAFCEEHPQYELTESNVADYQEFAEPAEISLDVFVQYINGTKGISTKYDQWGDVELTVREQTLEVIDSLPLTWQQKDALYLAAGYSESKIWDVPW